LAFLFDVIKAASNSEITNPLHDLTHK
jgi:hypothetical protein